MSILTGLACFAAGTVLGMILTACAAAGKRADEWSERWYEEHRDVDK